ncbi:MAG: hypothetical protein L3J09_01010 [Flavobacteriaceae bacterium]|nr:hypothetical protein [Flavobacteriaceae bacterium]
MLKQIIFAVMLLLSGIILAQNGTTSPYSYFGVGELKFKGTAENRAMGGMSVYSDSIHLNLQNPAGVAKLKLVNFTLGASYKYVNQETEITSTSATSTTLDYVAIGIPMGKFGASFGILPFTTVGYKLESDIDGERSRYTGTGGMNKVFLALAYSFTPDFSFGIDANYNFGNVEREIITSEEDIQLGTREFTKSNLLGFSFTFGAEYKKSINDYLEFTASTTYSPATSFTVKHERELSSVIIAPTGFSVVDTREITLENLDVKFPSQLTLGAGIGSPKEWFVGIQYTNLKTSNFNDPALNVSTVEFIDANKFRVGGFFVPNYNSLTSYWHRVVYRAGARYENNGINVRGEDINEFGISFGVGLPVGRLFSNINIGFELGSRGTTNNGLVKENFFNTFLSLSLNDRWFEKRYID